jgi:hypothetical protein
LTELRKFGLLFTVVFALIAAYAWWKGSAYSLYFLGAAGFFLVTGLFFEPVLKPIHRYWMKFAHYLAWLNTRILLGLFYYLVITPVGVIMRLFGKDFIDEKIDRKTRSYWAIREKAETTKDRYERLF